MTLISYAQNYEDVMLWRALNHLEQGFYIDVGAQDPEDDSVTKAFYDHGWSGVNIEPSIWWYEKLVQARPRDINLNIALGFKKERTIFNEILNTGLSSLDMRTVERHINEYNHDLCHYEVLVDTLTNVCIENKISLIHFLKIDVEGTEESVIKGINFSVIRPWIMIVESTFPNTLIESHSTWEPIILDSGYEFAYFDGLNRFYVAKEHSELMQAFYAPPNYFDKFIRASEYKAGQKVEEMQIKAESAKHSLQDLELKYQEVSAELKLVLSSHSWRFTRPLRLLGLLVRLCFKGFIKFLFIFLRSIRPLRHAINKMIDKVPGLRNRIESLYDHVACDHDKIQINNYYSENKNDSKISASAERIYFDLKESLKAKGQN